ncbi:MAG: NusG domain II-containing protein [Spirochaetes bacterium]|nr:NusG domain II-containing protein [Spirochaetota bacterium]
MTKSAAAAAAVVAATDKKYRVKAGDLGIISLGLALTILSAWLVYAGPAAARLVVQAGGVDYIYPLSENRIIEVPGPLGVTKIEIKDKAARIVESPCNNKTCISAGWQQGTGSWSACLPNTVFMRIDGEDSDEHQFDAVLH